MHCKRLKNIFTFILRNANVVSNIKSGPRGQSLILFLILKLNSYLILLRNTWETEANNGKTELRDSIVIRQKSNKLAT